MQPDPNPPRITQRRFLRFLLTVAGVIAAVISLTGDTTAILVATLCLVGLAVSAPRD